MPVGYEEENYSYGFNIDGVEIEQTLSQSFDPFSALDIDISTFQNTNQGLLDSNRDGRIPLGCFVFDDDNKLQNNFPDIFRDEKLYQQKNDDYKKLIQQFSLQYLELSDFYVGPELPREHYLQSKKDVAELYIMFAFYAFAEPYINAYYNKFLK